jgi:outer membrane protein TolC
LDADQERLRLGVATPYQVVTDQQSLAAAISTESQSLANYSHARVAFDQAMGRTLEANNISIDDATNGRVSRTSVLPAVLPEVTK